jgi:aerobic-type carbon monoxide dehydrogenase small subunit (CoxS/CutS family)
MAKPEQFNVSRRDFLKTAGVGSLATAVTAAGEADVEAQSGSRVVGPGEVPVTLTVNGRTVYSCSTLAIEVQGKQIRTVDGLAAANGTLHPVQQAFCDKDALMCGFCTPGFVMATVALIEKHPNPTLEQAKKGLDGNICRCGTFVRVLEAAMEAGKGGARG